MYNLINFTNIIIPTPTLISIHDNLAFYLRFSYSTTKFSLPFIQTECRHNRGYVSSTTRVETPGVKAIAHLPTKNLPSIFL